MLRPSHWYAEVHVDVAFPPGVKVSGEVSHGEARDGDALVTVKDVAGAGSITFDRTIDLPAGRVEPGAEYTAWQSFVRDADGLVFHDVLVSK
jgi:hypothetical protein